MYPHLFQLPRGAAYRTHQVADISGQSTALNAGGGNRTLNQRRFKRRASACCATPARETRDGSRTRDIGFADRCLDHLATRVKKLRARFELAPLRWQRSVFPARLTKQVRKEGVEPSRINLQQGL